MCLSGVIPCFLLYDNFSSTEQLGYIITVISFLGIGIGACIYQLVTQDKVRRVQAYIL